MIRQGKYVGAVVVEPREVLIERCGNVVVAVPIDLGLVMPDQTVVTTKAEIHRELDERVLGDGVMIAIDTTSFVVGHLSSHSRLHAVFIQVTAV